MTKKRYLVEVAQELITPVVVEAISKQEARELVMSEQGEPGDCYFSGHRIVSVSQQQAEARKDD